MKFCPEHLRKLALSNRKNFQKLVSVLKKQNPNLIDKQFRTLHEKEFMNIDCLECANCCRTLGPRLSTQDIDRLSKFRKIKSQSFFDKYLMQDEDGDIVFRNMPCPFIDENNYCHVYEVRPKACREYPHTDAKNIRSILNLCLKNTETCPVVFNIFKRIK